MFAVGSQVDHGLGVFVQGHMGLSTLSRVDQSSNESGGGDDDDSSRGVTPDLPELGGGQLAMSGSLDEVEASPGASPSFQDLLGESPLLIDPHGMKASVLRQRRGSIDLREPVMRIMDARPVINALSNALLGKGHEVGREGGHWLGRKEGGGENKRLAGCDQELR